MNTFNVTPTASPIGQSASWSSARPLFRGRSLLIVTLILAAMGVTAGWAWFGTAAMLPLLYVLPCAAMMTMCMKGHGSSNSSAAKPDDVAGASDTGLPQ
jgi:hypothetical protein